jgi:hypothetical protein
LNRYQQTKGDSMYDGLNQARVEKPSISPQLRDKVDVRIIPYDYVATFDLEGEPGHLREDVINISVEGTFIALAVGYGLDQDINYDIKLMTPPPAQPGEAPTLGDVTLANIPPHVLMDGFRLNPSLERLTLDKGRLNKDLDFKLANDKCVFQWLQGGWLSRFKNFNFLYNIIDTGSGRELQNAPIHNIAGLGRSDGERPFRMLAKPLAFLPRSSVRIQMEEKSAQVRGKLYIVLHGYKILGSAGVAEEHLRSLYQRSMLQYGPLAATRKTIQSMEQRLIPSARLVPFDYVGSMELTGSPHNVVETEIPINVEGGFVATSIGYSIALDDTQIGVFPDKEKDLTANLGQIPLTSLPITALKNGFRLKDAYQTIAFTNGSLATNLPKGTVNQLFEPLYLPKNVRFLYSIADTGTGRSWQNEPVMNISGLGISNGDRPFRNLAWPMHFLPRSTIQLRVEEVFGRGRLFIVFHGYKILGAT